MLRSSVSVAYASAIYQCLRHSLLTLEVLLKTGCSTFFMAVNCFWFLNYCQTLSTYILYRPVQHKAWAASCLGERKLRLRLAMHYQRQRCLICIGRQIVNAETAMLIETISEFRLEVSTSFVLGFYCSKSDSLFYYDSEIASESFDLLIILKQTILKWFQYYSCSCFASPKWQTCLNHSKTTISDNLNMV